MDTPPILLLEPIHPDARALLADFGRPLDAGDGALRLAREAPIAAILTRGRGRVTADLMDACPHLQVIARVGVGLDNIDVDAATARGIPVVNAPGSTTQAVAEQTLLLTLGLARRLVDLATAVKAGRWEIRAGYTGIELFEQTFGIIGMGDIGQRVAALASAFGMDVRYWSRTEKDVPYLYRPLETLLGESDVLSLHVALTPSTRHLIDADILQQMKPGALLINTARGAIVDGTALLDALDRGHLGGYGTDVWDPEPPPPDDPLLRHERVLAVPHVAAMTEATFRRMGLRTARNVQAILHGKPPEPGCIFNAAALNG